MWSDRVDLYLALSLLLSLSLRGQSEMTRMISDVHVGKKTSLMDQNGFSRSCSTMRHV